MQSCAYVASCWPCRLWTMFWAVSGQFGRFCFRLWKGFGKFNFRTTFVKHVAVTPCNSDVVTANISKHQLTSPRLGIKTCADFFACIVPQTLLGITPVFFLNGFFIFQISSLCLLRVSDLRGLVPCLRATWRMVSLGTSVGTAAGGPSASWTEDGTHRGAQKL